MADSLVEVRGRGVIWFPERREQRPPGEAHRQGAEWMAEEEWEGRRAGQHNSTGHLIAREAFMLRFPVVEVKRWKETKDNCRSPGRK